MEREMDEKIYRWIADYTEGSIGKEDFKLLKKWMEESPGHRAVFEDCVRMYQDSREIGFVFKMKPDESWESIKRKLKRRSRLKILRLVAAASILFAGILGGVSLPFWHDDTGGKLPLATSAIPGKASVMLYMADGKRVSLSDGVAVGLVEKDGTEIRKDSTNNTLVYQADPKTSQGVLHVVNVPVGGEFDLALSDGTHVWLNSDTELRFPTHFTGKTREVHVKGEAYFCVQKDTDHPFIVHTEGASVSVFGTEFNLSAYPGDRMVTTLTRGKVEVADGQNRVSLIPGEQAVWMKGAKCIDVRKVETSLYSSWVKGVFEFENMSLREIAKQLSRWYGVTFLFENEKCAERCFTGGIKKYIPLDQSLDIIEKTTNVIFKIKEKEVLVKIVGGV